MGHRQTVRDIILAHLPVLRRYAYGLAGNRADAEDLLQSTLLRAMEHQAGWRGDNGRAWLYAIMTNQNLNRLRGLARQPLLVSVDSLEIEDSSGSDPLLHNALMRGFATLPPDARAVLLLVAIEGFTYAEAATILDVPIGTVMSRLSRARRQLSDVLDPAGVTPLTRP